MIPFWHPGPLVLLPGVIEFHVFGLLVGLGVILGSRLAQRRAIETGLDPQVVGDLALWVVLVGFFFAHQVSLFAYFPERVFGEPCTTDAVCLAIGTDFTCQANGRCDNGSWIEVLKIWHGISSFGGFLGAFIGFVTFFRLKRIVIIPKVLELQGGKGQPVLPYLDTLGFGMALGWLFGRLGCFTAHDHIGALTHSFLAVKFPDTFQSGGLAHPDFGGVGYTTRWDLGLMEVFWSAAMLAFFWFWAKPRTPKLRPGFYTAMMMILYAPYRFWLDTLRAVDISGADRRYLATADFIGITPGQVGAAVTLLLGLWVWWLGGRARDRGVGVGTASPTPPDSSTP